jgi:isoquinoline 1-oxidoreductase alpha subunit
MAFTLKINGTPHKVDVRRRHPAAVGAARRARHDRDMTGTKFDGAATRSCITTVDSIGESAITTIEAASFCTSR